VRLIVASALFVGWLAWLGYTAAAKYRGPVVSSVQAAAAGPVIVAQVNAGEENKPAPVVKVTESLKNGSPAVGAELYIVNLADAKGFDGAGEYLLLLTKNESPRTIPVNGKELPMYAVVGLQRSPGYELPSGGNPLIYRMSDPVRKQIEKLLR
jgi:hypothetical protein